MVVFEMTQLATKEACIYGHGLLLHTPGSHTVFVGVKISHLACRHYSSILYDSVQHKGATGRGQRSSSHNSLHMKQHR